MIAPMLSAASPATDKELVLAFDPEVRRIVGQIGEYRHHLARHRVPN
jgi:hypothetical protein